MNYWQEWMKVKEWLASEHGDLLKAQANQERPMASMLAKVLEDKEQRLMSKVWGLANGKHVENLALQAQ